MSGLPFHLRQRKRKRPVLVLMTERACKLRTFFCSTLQLKIISLSVHFFIYSQKFLFLSIFGPLRITHTHAQSRSHRWILKYSCMHPRSLLGNNMHGVISCEALSSTPYPSKFAAFAWTRAILRCLAVATDLILPSCQRLLRLFSRGST